MISIKHVIIGLFAIHHISTGRLYFKLATADEPAPEKKHRGGEDANYSEPLVIAVADGVGGWNRNGVDPSKYSRKLMVNIEQALSLDKETFVKDPKALAVFAGDNNDETGSATLVIVSIDNEEGVLKSVNIGDSGYLILRMNAARQYEMVFRSQEMQHGFNFPFQIGTNGDDPRKGFPNKHDIHEGDIVIVGSDGLFDNVFDEQIISLINEECQNGEIDIEIFTQRLLKICYDLSLDSTYVSPFAANARSHGYSFTGGKSDDITIVVGQVLVADN